MYYPSATALLQLFTDQIFFMILQKLKEKTSRQHTDVESHPLLLQLTSGELSLPIYKHILVKFYGFFSPLEERISQHSPEKYLEDFNERRKAILLLQDIEILNGHQPIKYCESLPAIDDLYSAMGALYVMEGSTLGGQMISRHVEKALGLTPDQGTAFFYGYGKDTGQRWKAFQQALLALNVSAVQQKKLIAASQETFDKLNHWLSV